MYNLHMSIFKKTSHLSEILQKSEVTPVIVFKYSNSCGTSDELKNKLETTDSPYPIYLLTVQEMPNLSKNIEEIFNIKHESPQVFKIKNGNVIYTDHHKNIKLEVLLA